MAEAEVEARQEVNETVKGKRKNETEDEGVKKVKLEEEEGTSEEKVGGENWDEMFKDRFTERDPEYKKAVEEGIPDPPCLYPWTGKEKRSFDYTRSSKDDRGKSHYSLHTGGYGWDKRSRREGWRGGGGGGNWRGSRGRGDSHSNYSYDRRDRF